MNAFFVFSGQGAQGVGMGKDLYDNVPAAKAIFDEADDVLGYSLSSIIFNGPAEDLTRTKYCQTAIYTMSCAALEAFRVKFGQLKSIGCAGLSLGEYAALYAAGAFSFAGGLKLLEKRAAYMDEACNATQGSMASVLGGDAAVIAEVCKTKDIDVANYNNPGQIVISGETDKVNAAVEELKNRGMRKVIVLNVAGAFHSRLMQPAADAMKTVLAGAPVSMPQIPVIHNFTAEAAKDAGELKNNLANQITGSVRWEQCVRKLAAMGGDTMIEFGPGSVLTGLLRRTIPGMPYFNINTLESLNAFHA